MPVVLNPHFGKLDTRPLLTATIAAKELGHVEATTKALFSGMWIDRSGFENDATIIALLDKYGVPQPTEIVALGRDKGEALTTLIGAAETDGSFGVPSFLYDGQLYFGNDRMMFLEEALAA